MRAGLRAVIALAAAGLSLGATPAFAQTAPQTVPQSTTSSPPTDTVGPRDLKNFNLGGTVTRAPEPAATQSTAAPRAGAASTTTPQSDRAPTPSAPRPPRAERAQAAPSTSVERRAEAPPPAAPTVASVQPEQAPPVAASLAPAPSPGFEPAADPSAATLTPQSKIALWPWLLAAVALGAGGAFLFWRNRREESFAGGPQFDSFVAPEAAPRPVPRPAPKPAPAPPASTPVPEPAFAGIVTTRLRPTIEIGVKPLRFTVEDSRIVLELEIELVNSGSSPARGVLIEATLLNAGNDQDDQLRGFFANPVGEGQRIVAIPPLQHVALKTRVAVGREHVQQYDIGGKKVCVPLLALNALYSWNGKEAQTSVAYLIGRDTEGGKLAPFRLDLGPRLFRGIGLRQLPSTFSK